MSFRRAAVILLLVIATTACDRYIEQVTIEGGDDVSVVIEAEVNCTDEDAIELWGGDPCDALDTFGRTGVLEAAAIPGRLIDATRDVTVEGEAGRRSVRVEWTESVSAVATLTISNGRTETVDDTTTRAVFSTESGPLPTAATRGVPGRWEAGEFRIVAPERVVEHNGDRISGRTVIWFIDEDMPTELSLAWSDEEREIRVWWWLVGAVILGVVLTLMVVIEGPRAEAAAKDRT